MMFRRCVGWAPVPTRTFPAPLCVGPVSFVRRLRVGTEACPPYRAGSIQTDDFRLPQVAATRDVLRGKFAKGALIKIWGCNSGVENWVYSDGGVVDPRNNAVDYYWRALNEFNSPKPSIASAFAQFFNVRVYGARSGAHIEVRHQGRWIKSSQYKQNVGHWPGPKLPLKLVPDKGSYHEYLPK